MSITQIFDNCHPNFCVGLFTQIFFLSLYTFCGDITQILLASCSAVSRYIIFKVPKSALPNYKSIFVRLFAIVFTSDNCQRQAKEELTLGLWVPTS